MVSVLLINLNVSYQKQAESREHAFRQLELFVRTVEHQYSEE